ncbi:MAG: 4Fe-4S binding protein, partial [Gemmatimonadota bacterium]
ALTAAAVVWPLPMAGPANLLEEPGSVPIDWFYSFWLPITHRLPPGAVWGLAALLVGGARAVPWLTRPRGTARRAPAVVDERLCTGCEQCVHDCPYDAIEMVARDGDRTGSVARVKTDLCTSCGICIGSCPPMAIGPGAVTARDQLAEVQSFLLREQPSSRDVVMIGCAWSAARAEAARTGARLMTVDCVGAMHSSTVEFLLRGGAGGVLVVGCVAHDGRTREGVDWTEQRLFAGRKADLKERVDRGRIRLVQASLGEGVRLHQSVIDFAVEIEALAALDDDERLDLFSLCQPAYEPDTEPEAV